MPTQKRQLKALDATNLDLFEPESMAPPAPATLYTRIREAAYEVTTPPNVPISSIGIDVPKDRLPDTDELYQKFELFNWQYFQGNLPRVRIEYSNRMRSAGSYSPNEKLIRIGRKYHELFPEDIDDTLKHEMIHIVHFRHDAAFKREAARVGATLKARSHPSLRREPKYLYQCPGCKLEYPRQKRLRLASCGKCSTGGRFDKRFKLKLTGSAAANKSKQG